MKRISLAVVTVPAVFLVAGTFVLSGCSSVSKIINKGGDTTCQEFNSHDDEKQRSEVSKMLKDKNGSEPSNMELSATRVAVSAYCKTIGKDSDKISNAML
jgi:acid stress chaperone HdeA